MATWCAWCKPMRKLSEDPPEIETHGICEACLFQLKLEVDRHKGKWGVCQKRAKLLGKTFGVTLIPK